MIDKSLVATHPNRGQILEELLRGVPHTTVAEKYGLRRQSMVPFLVHAIQTLRGRQAGLRDTESVLAKITGLIERLEGFLGSMEEYLRDPDDPTKFTNDPFAEEVEVVYWDPVLDENGQVVKNKHGAEQKVRRRAALSELIKQHAPTAFQVTVKRDDSRMVYLKTHQAIREDLEVLSKILGLIVDRKEVVSRSEAWLWVMQFIAKATEKHPDIREAIVTQFEEQAKQDGKSDT